MIDETDQPLLAFVDSCHKFVKKVFRTLKNELWLAAYIDVNCEVVFVALRVVNDLE